MLKEQKTLKVLKFPAKRVQNLLKQALTGIIETFPYFALSSLFPSNYFWDIWIKPLFTLTVVDCFNYKPALAGIITLV